MRAQGQDRPAQEADVAQAALAAEIVRNHRFFNKKFNIAGTRARPQPRQTRPGDRQAAAAAVASLLKIREHDLAMSK